ncbi:dephospho-CoA kinase [Crocinitomicaceae bacterium]|nr:dephospho-CoA kinase [Crocinitomicaceae bacterium]
MLKIGITGGIGSGKSMVGKILESMGYPVFYSDDQAKLLADRNPEIRHDLIDLFGPEVYNEAGLNRPFLAEKIFGDETLRQQVNQIIHPRVREAFDQFADNHASPFVFNEAAILIETGAHKNFDALVLVTAPEEIRIQRVQARDNTDTTSIKQRMKKQWTDDEKRPHADYEIINDGEQPVLEQLEKLIFYLQSKA